ncbi:unnamed protein product [Symbiodinium sp. CCMP2592]|nr:unnamed protein product [Symbiodinium sp. CCMP2592]
MSLQCDFDESFSSPVRRKRKADGELDGISGPRSHAEADAWVDSTMKLLRDRGLREFGVDFADRLLQALQPGTGICMRSDYSGLGGPEEAWWQIAKALRLDHEVITCQRCSDIDAAAQYVLLHRSKASGCSRSCCVLGDIRERCSDGVLQALESLQTDFLAEANRICARGNSGESCESRDAVYKRLGKQFVKDAFGLLVQEMPVMPATSSAPDQVQVPCLSHNRSCPAFPSPQQGFSGLLCSVAGIICYDFSPMGAGKRFLGNSAIPFLIWARERLCSQEDFFVVECVTNFDDETLAELLADSYQMHTLRACPSLFGLPVTRDRKYMVFLARRSLVWCDAVNSVGPQEAFRKLFARPVVMRGDELLRAPDAAVHDFVSSLAVARGLPESGSGSVAWSCYLAMSPANRQSVRDHEQSLQAAGFAEQAAVLTNIAQRASHMGPVLSGFAPALLRSSLLWSFRLRRIVLPAEHLELQGYSLWGNEERRSVVSDVLPSLRSSSLRSLAGNAMHIQSIGSVLMFVVSCTVRQQ